VDPLTTISLTLFNHLSRLVLIGYFKLISVNAMQEHLTMVKTFLIWWEICFYGSFILDNCH
jgi:hypothetical protein